MVMASICLSQNLFLASGNGLVPQPDRKRTQKKYQRTIITNYNIYHTDYSQEPRELLTEEPEQSYSFVIKVNKNRVRRKLKEGTVKREILEW